MLRSCWIDGLLRDCRTVELIYRPLVGPVGVVLPRVCSDTREHLPERPGPSVLKNCSKS